MWHDLAIFGAGVGCGILLLLTLALVMQSSRISAAEDRRRVERQLWMLQRQNHVGDVVEDDEDG